MPIVIEIRQNLSCPMIECDHCQTLIETASDGNYEWDREHPKRIYFTHKACSTPFRASHPGVRSSMELGVLPIYLGDNLKVDWTRERQRADDIDLV